jgi:hypothetical protein
VFVTADIIKAPFVVGARVNRINVLFTTEHNIKRAGIQSGKSGEKRRFSAASGSPHQQKRLGARWQGENT